MAVSAKKLGWRVKKSSPSPLWGHRLPVIALTLSARGLDNHYGYEPNDAVYGIDSDNDGDEDKARTLLADWKENDSKWYS